MFLFFFWLIATMIAIQRSYFPYKMTVNKPFHVGKTMS